MNELQLIVKAFNDYATDKGYIFAHGDKFELNLKNHEVDNADDVFLNLFLLDPAPTKVNQLETNWGLFNGDIFIGLRSNMAETFYKANKDVAGLDYRFEKYFVPLFDIMKECINTISNCKDIDITVRNVMKRINYRDANLDGYLINFSAEVYV